MKARSTAILVGVTVLLAAFVYFVEIAGHEDEAAGSSAATGTRLFSLTIDEVVGFTIHVGSGVTQVTRSQGDAAWFMRQPVEGAANPDRVARALSAIVGVEASRVLPPEAVGSLGEFGLAQPAAEVVLELSSGERQVLWVGDTNPGNTSYYVMRQGDDTVFMVDRRAIEAATQLVEDPPHRPTPILTATLEP